MLNIEADGNIRSVWSDDDTVLSPVLVHETDISGTTASHLYMTLFLILAPPSCCNGLMAPMTEDMTPPTVSLNVP